MADKAATALVFFIIAIIAFALSACFAAATYGVLVNTAVTSSDNGDVGTISTNYSTIDNNDSYSNSSSNNIQSSGIDTNQVDNSNGSNILTNIQNQAKNLLGVSSNSNYSPDSSISMNNISSSSSGFSFFDFNQVNSMQESFNNLEFKINHFFN
jgi:predicted PurR-regulated permease PerM